MNNKRVSFWEKIMIFLNVLAVFTLLGSYISVFIDPAVYWPTAFLGLAYPFILAINLCFVLYWVICTRWWFLLSLAMAVAGYSYFRQTFSFRFLHTTPVEADRHSLRVMTYNVHFFRNFDGPASSDVKSLMLQLIKNDRPDVICFQEYFTRSKGNYNTRDSIFRILHSRHYFFHQADSNKSEGYGLAIFSRYPITDTQYIPLNNERNNVNGAISADIQLDNKIVRVFCIQLQSIKFDPEDYKILEQVKSDKTPDMKFTRMVSHKLKWAFIKRSAQARLVAQKIAASPYPVIVCGDFNDPPVSFALHTISKNLQNCFAQQGMGFARTYNGSFPNFQIDYILCSPVFGIQNYHIIEKELSDHFAVSSELSYH